MTTSVGFLRDLRDALTHLSDFDYLRRSPLADVFDLAGRFDAPAHLQRIMVAAIDSLRPKSQGPTFAQAWRVYELLYYRYVEQLSPQEVANQLGIGDRHLRREQQAALEALAQHLWREHGLEKKLADSPISVLAEPPGEDAAAVDAELAWLGDITSDASADLAEILAEAIRLVHPLAERYGVTVAREALDGLPRLAVHPVALSQMLLNLLSVALRGAKGGSVTMSAKPADYSVDIYLSSTCPTTGTQSAPTDDDLASLDMACRMAGLSGGHLILGPQAELYRAVLTLPALERLPVLALDDNVDTLQLLQRYSAGTRYRFTGTRDPGQLVELADKVSPAVIVLDVMMPAVDGWRLLAQLRQRQATEAIPIIICTILAQEELALSLGATGFLRKPVKREAFLAALDAAVRKGTDPC